MSPNRDKEANLSHERLKELLHYDPENGLFVRKVRTSNARKGAVAGTRNTSGHTAIQVDGKIYYTHRLAWFYMFEEWPNVIDHIDRDQTNNRISNLRNVTHRENMRNRRIFTRNRSGACGVIFNKQAQKWQATIRNNNDESEHLGLFQDINDAITARKNAEKLYGYHPTHGNVQPIFNITINYNIGA